MRQIVRFPQFLSDAKEIALHIATDSSESALRFLDAVDACVELLRRSPHIGSRITPETPQTKGWRVVTVRRFRNYLIYYRLVNDRVELVRIVHGARDQSAALEKMPST